VTRWWDRWRGNGERPRLDARLDGADIVVDDTRDAAAATEHVVRGLPATVLALCDRTTTTTQLQRRLADRATDGALRTAVDQLVADRLVARDGGQLVALPVFRDRPAGHPLLGPDRNDRTHAQTSAVPALLRLGRSA
jgi:hypothetical protein